MYTKKTLKNTHPHTHTHTEHTHTHTHIPTHTHTHPHTHTHTFTHTHPHTHTHTYNIHSLNSVAHICPPSISPTHKNACFPCRNVTFPGSKLLCWPLGKSVHHLKSLVEEFDYVCRYICITACAVVWCQLHPKKG